MERRRLPLAMLVKGGTQARDVALRVERDGRDVERPGARVAAPTITKDIEAGIRFVRRALRLVTVDAQMLSRRGCDESSPVIALPGDVVLKKRIAAVKTKE